MPNYYDTHDKIIGHIPKYYLYNTDENPHMPLFFLKSYLRTVGGVRRWNLLVNFVEQITYSNPHDQQHATDTACQSALEHIKNNNELLLRMT